MWTRRIALEYSERLERGNPARPLVYDILNASTLIPVPKASPNHNRAHSCPLLSAMVILFLLVHSLKLTKLVAANHHDIQNEGPLMVSMKICDWLKILWGKSCLRTHLFAYQSRLTESDNLVDKSFNDQSLESPGCNTTRRDTTGLFGEYLA